MLAPQRLDRVAEWQARRPDGMVSKADLHVHSRHSDRPSEWFLRRIGSPESFVEPLEIYRRARQRGMDFVTISDHNCIRGALEIAHLPGAFISVEITTYFPEDGCKVHVLATGIDPESFRMIQELRADIYQLHRYLVAEDILCSLAHPLYRINGRLTIDHVEKLLLMFNRFEAINGARDRRASLLVDAIFRNLTPELIAQMADRHGIEPTGPQPWKKTFVGGSDDHSGIHIGHAHTITPFAQDPAEFLAHLRRGEHEAAGACGGSVMMAQSLYHIAYSYYKSRFLGDGATKRTLLGELFKKLLESESPREEKTGFGQRLKDQLTSFVWGRQLNRLSDVERMLVTDFTQLFSGQQRQETATPPLDDRRTFQISCQISQTLGCSFLTRFIDFARQGKLIESVQTVASLAPVALSMAPYLAAFSTQHKDDQFFNALIDHFADDLPVARPTPRKAWISDTFNEVNGVSRTIEALAVAARRAGRPLTVLSCAENLRPTRADVKNFAPVDVFPLPEYESQPIAFPPFLEVIEYIERLGTTELIISTPGPMGLTGLAAARLLGLRTVGIYHTDFVQYIRYLSQDDDLADFAWKYLLWFYEQTDLVLTPTDYYRRMLIERGIDPRKIRVLARGVDTQLFHPDRRDADFFRRRGLRGATTFLYVGRLSREKGLDRLVEAFRDLHGRGHDAALAIVGEGPYREELERALAGLPVLFTGVLHGEELAAAYASANAFVFPSSTDTFGNVVLEAQAAGVPVIVTNRGGPAEIVRDGESGLVVDIAQPGCLAEAMERLHLDAQFRDELRQRGLANAAQCSWSHVLDDLWSLDLDRLTPAEAAAYRLSTDRDAPGLIALDLA